MKATTEYLTMKVPSRRAFVHITPEVERSFYGEFDGRRRKRVLVKVIGE